MSLMNWVCQECYDKFDKEYEVLTTANWFQTLCVICKIEVAVHCLAMSELPKVEQVEIQNEP